MPAKTPGRRTEPIGRRQPGPVVVTRPRAPGPCRSGGGPGFGSPASLPSGERRARYYTDVTRAFGQWAGATTASTLCWPPNARPGRNPPRPAVRDLISGLLVSGRTAPELRDLAARCSIAPSGPPQPCSPCPVRLDRDLVRQEPRLVSSAAAGDQEPDRLVRGLLAPVLLASAGHPAARPRPGHGQKIPVPAGHMRVRPRPGRPVADPLRAGARVELPRSPDERLSLLCEAIGQAAPPVIPARLIEDRDGHLVQVFELAALQRHPHVRRVAGRTALPAGDLELGGHLVMPPATFDGS